MNAGFARWRHLAPRTPVIVGVGIAEQRFDEPGAGDDAVSLMTKAAISAGRDSGASEIPRAIEQVAVPGGSWRHSDPGREVARRLGAERARTILMTPGIPQQTLLDHAYQGIRSGAVDLALVVGGEAAHRAVVARRAGVALADPVYDTKPDEHRAPSGELVSPVEIAVQAFTPARTFALIDCALRSAEKRSIEQHRDEVARLWAGFSEVAARFEHAWYRTPRSAEWIREPSDENRAICFPYNKWHCSQMNVDQAAAILICSLAAAERFGVDPDSIVFPVVALESSWTLALARRREIHRWPAMEVLGRAAESHLGCPLASIPHAEVYSCFPAAVRVQQRALGLPLDGIPTITGGEPFAGGPWNNFVLQATVAMIERIRVQRDEPGLVTTVSGFLGKPGLAVYSTHPGDRPPLIADLADEAAAATAVAPIEENVRGPATVLAYTVSYETPSAPSVLVLAETDEGARTMATCNDASLATDVIRADFVGARVQIAGALFEA